MSWTDPLLRGRSRQPSVCLNTGANTTRGTMNNFSIGPWSRVLVRLNAVSTDTIMASLPKDRKRGLTTPENSNRAAANSPSSASTRPQKRIRSGGATASSARLLQLTQAQPSSTRDPFVLLPLHVLSDIVEYLSPLDVIVHQRVSKSWRVILASEYIYTLALRFHFPFSPEAKRAWRLHRGGERFPEAAVGGYRAAAARYTRRPRQISTIRCGGMGGGRWVAADGWLAFDEGYLGRDNRIGVQKLGVGAAGRGWIKIGMTRVQDLAIGGGFLRGLFMLSPEDPDDGYDTGPWVMRLYDLKDLSLVWEVSVPQHVEVTQNMSDSHTGYIAYDKKATMDGAYPGGTMDFHLLSLATGEATLVLKGIECRLSGTRSSYLTPNCEILAVGTHDNIYLFSIPSGGTLLSTIPNPYRSPPPLDFSADPPRLQFDFSEVTNALSIIDDYDIHDAKSWKIHIRSATDVELREAINYHSCPIDEVYGFDPPQATQLFGPHGDSIVLFPFKEGLEIEALCYDGAVDYTRRKVHPQEEEGVMELEPRRRIPGMWLKGAVRDERWVVIKGSDAMADPWENRVSWTVVDFGTD